MDFVEAIRQYKGYEAALRHINSEKVQIPDLDHRIENAKGCMENAAQEIVHRYLVHIVEHDKLDENLVTCLKAITHTYLHMLEVGDKADATVWDGTLLKRIAAVNEAQCVQDGYAEMFCDLVKTDNAVRAMVESRHDDLERARRDLLIVVLQAAEAGHQSDTLIRAYNLVR